MKSERAKTILTRRGFVGGLTLFALPGCTTDSVFPNDALVNEVNPAITPVAPPAPPVVDAAPVYLPPEEMYAALTDGKFALPAIPFDKIDPKYYRQAVPDPTGEAPGTLVVDTANRFLYLVQPFGEAVRYGVAIGKEGFAWSGAANIERRAQWPTWTPPAEMIERDPKLAKYSAENGGMEGGLKNPLGARALYIYQNGVDTLYRIHGSPEWKSIGKKASSGCVRLINQDIIDLHRRVPPKAPVVVLDEFSPLPITA
jgi:lipoprotein-anchoring transpeptidase ErfK/SrfK